MKNACGLEDLWLCMVELAYVTFLFSLSSGETMALVIIHGLGLG